jgi:hypothetical protein
MSPRPPENVYGKTSSVVSSVLENGAGDGTGFDTRSGPGYDFECGMGNVRYSKSFSGAENGLE